MELPSPTSETSAMPNCHIEVNSESQAKSEPEKDNEHPPKVAEMKDEPVETKHQVSEIKPAIAKSTADPEFALTTKNLERIREELRQEEIMQGRKSPFKSETSSPIKLEPV